MKFITLEALKIFKNNVENEVENKFKSMFDLIRPIGDTYVQYPQQKSPMDLWGTFSTWEVINYDGAFFRAEGTNANAFIEESGNLVKQKCLTESHSHDIEHKHTRGTMNITGMLFINGFSKAGVAFNQKGALYATDGGGNWGVDSGKNTANGVLNFDASRDWNGETSSPTNTKSGTYGSVETRPVNYTYRIWKRIS